MIRMLRTMRHAAWLGWLAAGVLVATGCSRQKPAPAWSEDDAYVYALDLHSSAASAAMPVPMFSLDVKGKLRLSSLEPEGDLQRVRIALEDVQVGSSSEAEPRVSAFSSALQRPFELLLRNGVVDGLRIDEGTDYVAVALLRTIASALQVAPAPEPEQTRYEAREFDSTGRYVARYERPDKTRLRKQKLRYETVLSVGDRGSQGGALKAPEVQPEIKSSAIAVQFDEATPRDVTLAEETLVALMDASKLSYSTSLSLKLLERKPLAKSASASPKLVYLAAKQAYAPAPRLSDLDSVRIGDLTFQETIARLEAIAKDYDPTKLAESAAAADSADGKTAEVAIERNRYFTALAAFYRQDPAYVARGVALARGGSPAAKWVISALGASGTPEGQAALAGLITEDALGKPLQKIAGLALVQANQPLVASARAFEALLEQPEWQQFALFAVGIYARRMREVGQTAEAERLAKLLLQRLARAKEKAELRDALGALSNAAYAPATAAIRPFLTHAEPAVRQAALQALRLIDSEEVDRLMITVLGKDASEDVRALAADTARERPTLRRPVIDAVATAAAGDADVSVRLMAVRSLGAWLPTHPDLRKRLEAIAKQETDANVLLTVTAVLNAKSD